MYASAPETAFARKPMTGDRQNPSYPMNGLLSLSSPIVAQAGYVTETSMGESLVRTGSGIYLAGTSDVPKENGPAGGGYWNAGLVASLDETGAVRWTRLVTLTAHSERFRALWVVGSRLFAVGSGAGYNIVSTGEMFGYGLLTELESATGLEVASWTLGDEHFDAGFNGVWADATRAIAGGWKPWSAFTWTPDFPSGSTPLTWCRKPWRTPTGSCRNTSPCGRFRSTPGSANWPTSACSAFIAGTSSTEGMSSISLSGATARASFFAVGREVVEENLFPVARDRLADLPALLDAAVLPGLLVATRGRAEWPHDP